MVRGAVVPVYDVVNHNSVLKQSINQSISKVIPTFSVVSTQRSATQRFAVVVVVVVVVVFVSVLHLHDCRNQKGNVLLFQRTVQPLPVLGK